MNAFASNLSRTLKERALTLKKVSQETGIPISTLSEWTAGREPKVSEALIKLSVFLQISLDDLILARGLADVSDQGIVEFTVVIQLDDRRYRARFQRVG